MTDYNNGAWWGWNGGECPVHPKSVVDIRYSIASYDGIISDEAGNFLWGTLAGPSIVAFRVVKAYREPREAWSYGAHMRDTLAEAEKFRADVDSAHPGNGYGDGPITHWVEFLP